MKKVLVVGAAGAVGIHTVKYLLSEGKYEITILDLKNKKSFNRLKRFRKRVNILYGDVTDRILIEALVKDHDYISSMEIHNNDNNDTKDIERKLLSQVKID